jgi:hypothetical protein
MIIDYYNKIIFIAIPKTGTTSTEAFMEKVLSSNSKIYNYNRKSNLSKHSSALEIKRYVNNYDEFKKIAVVRNPYDWYVSWYTYRKRKNSNFKTNNMTFLEYIGKSNHREIMDFILDENGNLLVDYIVRYEDNIENEMKKILCDLGIECRNKKFPTLNISEHRKKKKKYQNFYNEEEKKLVEKYQKRTIEYFGYEF